MTMRPRLWLVSLLTIGCLDLDGLDWPVSLHGVHLAVDTFVD